MTCFRILSVDGGGIRGLLPAYWLSQLDERLQGEASKKRLSDAFDMFAGTSTGAIIAAALAGGFRDANGVLDFYKLSGQKIFPLRGRTWGLRRPKYNAAGLNELLRDVFKNHKLGDISKRLIITSFDIHNRQAIVFDNDHDDYKHVLVRDACVASASAPTYFPVHIASVRNANLPLIDGGVAANNPTGIAIARALSDGTTDRLFVLSLGTGEVTTSISEERANNWGRIQWAAPIVSVLFDGNSGITDEVVRSFLAEASYIRLQARLDKLSGAMDDASPENLKRLLNTAAGEWNKGDTRSKVDQVVKVLSSVDSALDPAVSSATKGETLQAVRVGIGGVSYGSVTPLTTPEECIRSARDNWGMVINDCIGLVTGNHHTAAIRSFLTNFASGADLQSVLTTALEDFDSGVARSKRLSLLIASLTQFSTMLVLRIEQVRGEIGLLNKKIGRAKKIAEQAQQFGRGHNHGASS